MAKKESKPRGIFSIDNLVNNVNNVNEKLNQLAQVKTQKKYSIYFTISENDIELFNKLYAKFIFSVPKLGKFYKKDFFRMLLNTYKNYLESENAYLTAENESVLENILAREGHRKNTEKQKPISFGDYSDNSWEIFKNISYSIANQEVMANMQQYKKGYFAEKIIRHASTCIDTIITNYKDNKQ